MKGPGAESSACGQGAKQKPSVTLAQHTMYSFLGGIGWGGDKKGRVCFLYSNKNMFWKVKKKIVKEKPKSNIFKELKVTLDLELYTWKSYLLRMRVKIIPDK